MDTPANLMTPTVFAERAEKEFKDLEGVTVNVYDEGNFLSRAQALLHDRTLGCMY